MIQTRAPTTDPMMEMPDGSSVVLASRADVSALATHPTAQKAVQLGTIEPPLQALFKYWSKSTACALALLLSMLAHGQPLTLYYAALGVGAVLLSRLVFTPTRLRPTKAPQGTPWRIARLVGEWALMTALLVFMGEAFGLARLFPRDVLISWFGATLAILMLSDLLSARVAARIAVPHRHIIIGANDVGMELARRGAEYGDSRNFLGFFDFRNPDRLPAQTRDRFLGAVQDVADFVQRHAVNAIYIAIPMSNAARIVDLVQEFRDTTASIYFVPDMFAFDLVQPRCVEFNGIPLLSVCDTPFHGMDAVYKRAMDLLLVSLVLLFAWPVMLAVAMAVKLSSPGPVLFKQRRYGLHGEQILVYKFRSMTVCEDGPNVKQAERSDRRVTTIGRFLRRTSLDELPQLFNVLEGKMSFVGPRPHAVVHNELYRKLISGYMIRHKVRPGMTGWAQVHGLRGETSTVEQMRLRVQYDLDYLRQWSIWLDAKILLRTALIVIHGRNAH